MFSSLQTCDVRSGIREAIGLETKSLDDVAELLHVSRSTIQRHLAEQGTSFTELRKEVQVEKALDALTSRKSVAEAARLAFVDPDHLCVLIKRATGLTPLQVSRAASILARIDFLRGQTPARFGSPLYRKRFREWHRLDDELDRLVGDLAADNPLSGWAKATLVAAARPDFRRQPYRRRIREERRREAEEFEALMRSIEERFAFDRRSFVADQEIFGRGAA